MAIEDDALVSLVDIPTVAAGGVITKNRKTLAPRRVRSVLVPPRCLPFTSSGKLSRAGAKRGYVSGEIADLEEVEYARSGAESGRVAMQAAE